MDALMLDGNAVAGLLQEVFAVEMTTATRDVRQLRRNGRRSARCTSTAAPASSCAAHTATTPS